jgi:hypothetical protein
VAMQSTSDSADRIVNNRCLIPGIVPGGGKKKAVRGERLMSRCGGLFAACAAALRRTAIAIRFSAPKHCGSRTDCPLNRPGKIRLGHYPPPVRHPFIHPICRCLLPTHLTRARRRSTVYEPEAQTRRELAEVQCHARQLFQHGMHLHLCPSCNAEMLQTPK